MGWFQASQAGGGLKSLDDGNHGAYSQVCVSIWMGLHRAPFDGSYQTFFFKDYDWALGFDYFYTGGIYCRSGGVTQSTNQKVYTQPEIGRLHHWLAIFDNDGASGEKVNLYRDGELLTANTSTSNSVTAGTKFNNTQIGIGCSYDGSRPIDAIIGEWAILCGGVPTVDEIRRMALGESPRLVRPDLFWDGHDGNVDDGIVRTDRQRWFVYAKGGYWPLPPCDILTIPRQGFLVGDLGGGLSITGSGYADSDVFGAGQVNLGIIGAGYADSDAYGAGRIDLRIDATGYADSDAYGAARVDLGIAGTGYADADAFGGGQLDLTISAAGYVDADGFGAGQLNLTITAAGYADADAFGAGTVSIGALLITGAGYADADAFGAGQINLTLLGAGYADADAFGAGTLTIYLLGAGFSNGAIFGAGAIGLAITGQGFIDGDAFGAGRLDLTVLGAGYANAPGYGGGLMVPGGVSIAGAGYANAQAFGAGYLYFASPSGYKVIVHKPGRSQQVAGAGHKATVPARPRSTIIIRRP